MYHLSRLSYPKGKFLRFNLRINFGDGLYVDYMGCLAGIKKGVPWVKPPSGEARHKVSEWSPKVQSDLIHLLMEGGKKNYLEGLDSDSLWKVTEEIDFE